ncbi:hypothetical protein J8L70_09740 [Pseudoalteromonas sp. MMG010]|uniref:DUF7305 domain-containing protein n=1 Tax=Pseudoalteromonas sp. MMG010 TaxID=2822685 RepID=UPI001B39FBE5|nr:hypothetical protein [Pseudoalteromonas sp. MMG010]MBQ4833519.1 hypothetical protein [Pseudoalteromonas sp. MMG010]
MKSKAGYTLITVLLLTSVASIVVLSSLHDTVLQERLSGNFQKKLNARLMSEKGVYDSMAALLQTIEDQPTISIEDLMNENSEMSASGELDNMHYSAMMDVNSDGDIVVSSTGERYEGEVTLQAVFELVTLTSGTESTVESVFDKAITGCASVAVTQGTSIDSFDSSLGEYGATLSDGSSNISQEAFVYTLDDDSEIVLSGSGNINGDVISSDALTLSGSAYISGNVHSNGDLVLSGNSIVGGNATSFKSFTQSSGEVKGSISANDFITIKQVPVGGSLTSQGDISVTGNTIQGAILSGSDVYLSQTTINGGVQAAGNYQQTGGTVYNGVRVTGNVALNQWGSNINGDDLRYSGSGSFQGDHPEYYSAPYKSSTTVNVDDVPAVELITDESESGFSTCDSLAIDDEVSAANNSAIASQSLTISNNGNNDYFQFENTKAAYLENNSRTPDTQVTPNAASFLDTSTDIYYFDDVSITGNVTVKEGHNVVLLIRGDFSMSGAASLTIPEESSMTVLITGQFEISGGAQVYTPVNGITSQGQPVFSIYSSYTGTTAWDPGIYLGGGSDEIYAAIYAPYTNVEIASHFSFMGSILADTVNVSGSGDIHYDTALSEASFAGSAGSSSSSTSTSSTTTQLVFKEWQYVYDQTDSNN